MAALSTSLRRKRLVADSLANRDPIAATVDTMRYDSPACAGIVAAPVMPMPPVIVIVAGADRHAEIFRLCGSCGANGRKTQNDGSDCNVCHAYAPNASCWERKPVAVPSTPRLLVANDVGHATCNV